MFLHLDLFIQFMYFYFIPNMQPRFSQCPG